MKRAIWEHEKDELIHDDRMGRAHVTEDDLQAGDESLLAPGAKAAYYAWLYCAREKPWLEGLVYSHILERRNNNAIVKGGGLVERWKRKQRAELGAKEAEKDFQTEVHAVADEDHSDIFEPIFTRYVDSEAAAQAVLAATRDGLVDRPRYARRVGGRDVGSGVSGNRSTRSDSFPRWEGRIGVIADSQEFGDSADSPVKGEYLISTGNIGSLSEIIRA